MCDFIGLSLSTLLGAFFGALFAYWFALHQRKQESVARRAELLKLLDSELRTIGGQLAPYDVAKAIYRDPIRLSAPGNLLDGNTLTYKANAAVIQMLQQFQVAVCAFHAIRPPIPATSGHAFHGIRPGQSERSDAGPKLRLRGWILGCQFPPLFAH